MQFAMVLTSVNVCAADPQGKTGAPAATALSPVEVSALRDPVEKSYRKIVRGMDLFEKRRSLAPNAALHFKLLPRSRDTNIEGTTLSIVSESLTIPVPVAADNTFALERFQRALDEDAAVIPNRKARSMTWRTDVRTPGLPPNTRRLGDLRLECLVGEEAELISDFLPFFGHIARLLRGGDYCNQREVQYLFFAERPLFSVTLVAGSRREVVSVDRLYAGISRNPMTRSELQHCDCEVLIDRTYYAPLGDPSWPDDTLLELEYMDDGVASSASDSPAAASRGPSP
ncbi:MAG: hypothetical protein JWN13_650 [Betaproteobacteria bacterium]|jgi:hypothetical protein|nr:hypothetical protein [Betaproteobacteria bacterium]